MADKDAGLAGTEAGVDAMKLSDEIEALSMYDHQNGVHVQLASEVRKLEAVAESAELLWRYYDRRRLVGNAAMKSLRNALADLADLDDEDWEG